MLFTLVKEPRMKTSSSTKKKQVLKAFFPWSFGQEDEGKNLSSLRLLLTFFLGSDEKEIAVAA